MTTMVANRYEPLYELGRGGMGIVYCVKDRLSNRLMALKQVSVDANQLHFHLSGTQSSQKLALAMEFRTLASLHHPHIVDVVDYGFDNERQPYFAMEYIDEAQTITEYTKEKSDQEKLRLLAEKLEALAYLHQRGVIHRDLKPENVLVNQSGQVKVTDFGLAVASDHQQKDLGGTLAYMAPEVFTENRVSIRSDLFAVGIMAYEIFAGQHPYDNSSTTTLIDDILACRPDFSKIDSKFEQFVRSLMMKSPDDRPTNAKEALAQLSKVSDRPIPIENQLIRESFLQHATFIGRNEELGRLKESLKNESGYSWLIGGESGVGKSRLLDEFRIHALVNGRLVLRGYEVEENDFSYQLWRDIIRRLVLVVKVSDSEAGILKEVAPDIGGLLGYSIPDAPEISGTARQQRLIATILDVFRRLQQPTLLVLEDLQWAEESLFILKQLNTVIDDLPLVIAASYRDDERTDLSEQLPSMQKVHLNRLSKDQIATLTSRIIGNFNNQQKVTEKLHEQTEGNVFFLVEVLRALAEDSGGLDKIPETDISSDVLTSGIRNLLRRSISRIPNEFQPFLEYVALAGRYLEIDLVAYLHELNEMTFSLDSWLQACSDAAIIEYVEEKWRFRHDKLRDAVLEELQDPTPLHQQVATALESVYPDSREARKFHHWHSGEKYERAIPYAVPAAEQFGKISNNLMAIDLVEKALVLPIKLAPLKSVELYLILAESQRILGQFDLSTNSIETALSIAKPNNLTEHIAELQSILANIKTDQGLLNEAEALLLETQALLTKNDIDAPKLTANIILHLGSLMMYRGFPQKAVPKLQQAIDINQKIENQYGLAVCMENLGNVYAQLGKFEASDRIIKEALATNRTLGNRSSEAYCLTTLGINAIETGNHQGGLDYLISAEEIAHSIGDLYELCNTLANQGAAYVELKDYKNAKTCYQKTLEIAKKTNQKSMVAYCIEMLADVATIYQDYATARTNLLNALQIYDQMGDGFRVNLSACLSKTIHACIQLKENETARKFFKRMIQETPTEATERSTVYVLIGAIDIAILDQNYLQATLWYHLVKRYKNDINTSIRIPESIKTTLSANLTPSQWEVAKQHVSETSITAEFLKLVERDS